MKHVLQILQVILVILAMIAGITLADLGARPISAVQITTYQQTSPPPELKYAQPMVPWLPYGHRGILA